MLAVAELPARAYEYASTEYDPLPVLWGVVAPQPAEKVGRSARGKGTVSGVPVYLIQHADKLRTPGDPGITDLGRWQAERTSQWARGAQIDRIYCSPLLRSRQTAQIIAEVIGTEPITDPRATERMNWDGQEPFAVFSADWARTVEDRAYTPASGDSSHTAAQRLGALVSETGSSGGPVAIVTHGGVTVDLLRTLLGDNAIDRELLINGVPSCAITTIEGSAVASVASVEHLTS